MYMYMYINCCYEPLVKTHPDLTKQHGHKCTAVHKIVGGVSGGMGYASPGNVLTLGSHVHVGCFWYNVVDGTSKELYLRCCCMFN